MYLTKQQIFDTVLTKLREQGVASETSDGQCLYRGPNGLKCAVGHLIPDNVFKRDWEHRNAGTLPDEAYQAMGVALSDRAFLIELQDVHDFTLGGDHGWAGNLVRWEESMRRIAGVHGLTYTPAEVQQ